MFILGYSNTCIMPYVTEITICDGVTNIGAYAFAGSTSLNSLTIGNSVTSIDIGMCFLSGLTTVTYKGTKANWESIAKSTDWSNNSSITKIVCTDGEI